jgi:rare lipoprotein A
MRLSARNLLAVALLVLLAGSFLGCGAGASKQVQSSAKVVNVQQGKASWYGKPYHGRQTASGERYDMYDHTAAHKKLPFGTKVRVTNLTNGRHTTVRINDRGPFVRGRVIDLSYSAAKQIDMVQAGVVPVKLEILSTP